MSRYHLDECNEGKGRESVPSYYYLIYKRRTDTPWCHVAKSRKTIPSDDDERSEENEHANGHKSAGTARATNQVHPVIYIGIWQQKLVPSSKHEHSEVRLLSALNSKKDN